MQNARDDRKDRAGSQVRTTALPVLPPLRGSRGAGIEAVQERERRRLARRGGHVEEGAPGQPLGAVGEEADVDGAEGREEGEERRGDAGAAAQELDGPEGAASGVARIVCRSVRQEAKGLLGQTPRGQSQGG